MLRRPTNQHCLECCGAQAVTALGPGCAKTKSDLVVMPSRGRIFAFFSSARDHRAQNSRCGYTASSFHTAWVNCFDAAISGRCPVSLDLLPDRYDRYTAPNRTDVNKCARVASSMAGRSTIYSRTPIGVRTRADFQRNLAPGCLAANRPGFPVPIDREVCECHAAGDMEELRIDTQNGKHIYVRDAGGSVVAPSDPETVTSPFGSTAGLRRVARSFRRVLLQSLRATLIGSMPTCFHQARSSPTR
jgi:hypothetical protein